MRRIAVAAMVLFVFTGLIFAQTTEPTIIYKKVTVISPEDDLILGGKIKGPSIYFYPGRSGMTFPFMINLKKDFNKELIRSTEDLQ